jgi:protein subunit release factor A
LFDVYKKYATANGWQANVIDSSPGDDGGYKNIVMDIRGDKVYSKMKWEAGVHRVQRVPATESQGRVHTSTATVAVMPEVDELDVKIDAKDIEMSTCRSGGAGGQVCTTSYFWVRSWHNLKAPLSHGLLVSGQQSLLQYHSHRYVECQQSRNGCGFATQTNRYSDQMHARAISIEKQRASHENANVKTI